MSNGGYAEAIVLLEKATFLAPFNAQVRCLLGEAQTKTGDFSAAILNLEKAVQAAPKNAVYHSLLAQALMPARPSEAIQHFQTAIGLGWTSPDAFCKLAALLLEAGREEDALRFCDLGLEAWPDHLAIMSNRVVVLQRLGRLEEALACCYRQQELQPDYPPLWYGLGDILQGLGRFTESAEALRHACLLTPEYAEAHYNLAFALLLDGQYLEGFREYEWRWKSIAMKDHRQNFVQPLWDGSFLGERRILLHAEQGAGDAIQFARYVPLVEKLGGQLILEAPPSLVRLMTWMPGRHQITPVRPPASDFDVHCPLLSLPLLFGTDAESIPPQASFVIPGDVQRSWAQRVVRGKINVALKILTTATARCH
jgi:Flp pilus assembly protein TadD